MVVEALEDCRAPGGGGVEFGEGRVAALGEALGAQASGVDPDGGFGAVGREFGVGFANALEHFGDGGAVGQWHGGQGLAVVQQVEVGVAEA